MTDYPIRTPQQLGPILQGFRRERQLIQRAIGLRVGLAQIFKVLSALNLDVVVRPRNVIAGKSEW
jgi:hypothetical protein